MDRGLLPQSYPSLRPACDLAERGHQLAVQYPGDLGLEADGVPQGYAYSARYGCAVWADGYRDGLLWLWLLGAGGYGACQLDRAPHRLLVLLSLAA